MKRIFMFLMSIIILISTATPAFAIENLTSSQQDQINQNMWNHLTKKNHELLLHRDSYAYISFADKFMSDPYAITCTELINTFVDTGSILEIEKEKYMEVLINIMALSEYNDAPSMAQQNEQDNLKTFQDYAMDIAKMGAQAAGVLTGLDSSVGALGKGISTALEGINVLAESTENWIEAFSNLETVLQNYAKHDRFLSAIEKNSTGNLKQAASVLRKSMTTATEIKLSTYVDISNENFGKYSEFFFEEFFFDIIKQHPQYASDDTLKFFVDAADSFVSNAFLLKSSFELGAQIGKLIGNISVGGEDLIVRVRDMVVLRNIHSALSNGMLEIAAQFLEDYQTQSSETLNATVFSYVELSKYLMNCAIRGEYCLYSVVANDAGLLSWFNKKDAEDAERWYDNRCQTIEAIQEKYFNRLLQYNTDIPSNVVTFNGHYYCIYDFAGLSPDETNTWESALSYCEGVGGYLATISSKEENDFLYDYMKRRGYSSAYFGLTDSAQEGQWEWCNGERMTYTNWNRGELQGGTAENYAMFYWKYADGTWNDGNFSDGTQNGGTAFICEWGEYEITPNLEPNEPVRTSSSEREIVLVLDVSGSMSGTPMAETKKASINFIGTILDEDASIGIVTYDDSASVLSDLSRNETDLTTAVSNIYDGGGTNIESGLAQARSMLSTSSAKKKIIILMSDGQPNYGKEGDALIAYADEIKDDGIIIYTLGFFESMGNYKSSAQILMEGIASDGCHYEVASADDLVFFFEDVADQINGQKYIYIRIACPVDVTVTHKGETLCSSEVNLNMRTNFGTLTFEENENITSANDDDRIKVLRLKEGVDYDVQITGTGHGLMDYTIGFMDENGDYTDFRRFENVKITRRTIIDTVASVSKTSVLNIDEDGDGRYDLKLSAEENGYGEEVKNSILIYASVICGVLLVIVILVKTKSKKRRNKEAKETV